MMPETTVTIKIVGVREERLDRLRTVVKTHLQQFGREVIVDDGKKKPLFNKGK